jgi:hypothetical protein
MSDVRYFMEEIDVTAVVVGVLIAIGCACFVMAAACAWERLKNKYDPVFLVQGPIPDDDTSLDQGRIDIDEKALRRMMKQTAKEMDWTKVRWG